MEILRTWWPLILSAIAGIVWLVRLEGKIVKNNTVVELHKNSCTERHTLEKEHDIASRNELRESINQIFALIRTIQSGVDEIRGWKSGQQGK